MDKMLLLLIIIITISNFVFSIPNQKKNNLIEIKLFDYREIAYNEYELISTNLNTDNFIDFISPFPLSIDNDIYCENYIYDIKEVIILSCYSWNKLKFYNINEYYKNCYIKRNIKLFGILYEYIEEVNNKC